MRRHTLLAALLTAALAGCGGDEPAAPAAAPTDTIRIAGFAFSPDPATVKVGREVAVANADRSPHTITEEGTSPSFDSGTIKGKSSGSVTFEQAGTYRYLCLFHATMKGTVTVVE